MAGARLTRSEARRIAMAAQGLDRARPGSRPDVRHLRRAIHQLGLLQLDYVNVLMPAQFLVLWSRLGAYDRQRYESFLYASREFTEQWAHEASIVPVACWPLLEHRRRAHRLHQQNPLRRLRNRARYLDQVLRQVSEQGAVTAADLPAVPGPRRRPGDWHRSMPRWALEYHFARGSLAVAGRLPNFQRVYDLPERVLPAGVLGKSLLRADAERDLRRVASRAHGIATLRDLADYFRMPTRVAAGRVAELVEEGTLAEVRVDGWPEPAFLAAGARCPRRIPGACLLSPFDPLVWYRPRAERLFDFHYRIEIYVPAQARKWGYYVLPFRRGDDIVARLDLKADRQRGALVAPAVYLEKNVDAGDTIAALAAELERLANWLGLGEIRVPGRSPAERKLAGTFN
jgi:uncharacterized protein YcaQ